MRGFAGVLGLVGLLSLAGATVAAAADFTVTGSFFYEDRIWDGPSAYTGQVQNLPIRHADVEVVRTSGNVVLATGSTDSTGAFSIFVTGQSGTVNLYVRCLAASDNSSDYHIKVVNTFTRTGGTVSLAGSTIHAIVSSTTNHNTNSDLNIGSVLIQDTTGLGVAQAFNIFDNAVDAFDYLNTPQGIGRFPTAGEFIVYGWNPPSGSTGSNYFWQGVFLTATNSDTDGWSDTVILHETGHWASDMFGRDDNPGGPHYIGDNAADPRLAYGEGYATFFCAQVREHRALASPSTVDHVSLYADLAIPALPPTPGNGEFWYDFEDGTLFGSPMGQIGSANETNVTSVMWDLVDGPGTPDESPGVDDEPADEDGQFSWDVIRNYMTTISGPTNWITIEDFYDGWFLTHGPTFLKTEVDSAFLGLGGMPFHADAFEPNESLGQAQPLAAVAYSSAPGGGVVINEVDLGGPDAIEFQNVDTVAVDMTGWQMIAARNDVITDVVYTFPDFTLQPGSFVILEEGGAAASNTATKLYIEGENIQWANGADGACALLDDGGVGVDFVRWDNSSGTDPSNEPVPAGTVFTGSVFSPAAPRTLARDVHGTDTDDASDFTGRTRTLAGPNDPPAPVTLWPDGDVDWLAIDVDPGALMWIQIRAPHSRGEPVLELFDPQGLPVATESASGGAPGLAELQFITQDSLYYARIRHQGPYTKYAIWDVSIFQRPYAALLQKPVAVRAEPQNQSDSADTVRVTWLNGGAYGLVTVFRNGSPRATLTGSTTSYTDLAPRGEHVYSVEGTLNSTQSEPGTTTTFAGVIDCYLDEGLETGVTEFALDSPWNRTTLLAQSGSWSLTDSPTGKYGNNINKSARIIVPRILTAYPTLEFDHICITEADYDYGYVEISSDYGNSWTTLAQYDMGYSLGWGDGVANAGDWVHESISLQDYVGKKVTVRFRLQSDSFVTEDGWFLDNIRISDIGCQSVTAVPEDPATPVLTPILRLAGPNPFRSQLRMTLNAPAGSDARVQIFDTQGRLVAVLLDGTVASEGMTLTWDGTTRSGGRAAAGFYLLRAVTERGDAVQRVVKLN